MDKLQFLVLIVIYRPSLRALAAHRQRASLITLSIGPSNFVVTPALRYSSGSIHRTVYSSHLFGGGCMDPGEEHGRTTWRR